MILFRNHDPTFTCIWFGFHIQLSFYPSFCNTFFLSLPIYRHGDSLAGVFAVQPGDRGGGAHAGSEERGGAVQQCGSAGGALDPARRYAMEYF